MAYDYGNTINSRWRAYLSYSVTTNNDTTYSITCTVGMQVISGSYRSYNASASLSSSGLTTYTGTSKNIGGSNDYHALIKSKVYTWTKGTTAVSKTINYQFKTSGGTVAPGTSTGSYTFNVPQRTHWSVTYNANGGSGAPSASTKFYGINLTLSSTIPTRTGYTFKGWATSSTGAVVYNAGGTYTANSGATLYAVWQINTSTITYNPNGGVGSIPSQTKTYGQSVTLSNGVGFTKTNYSLVEWNTQADGNGTAYQLGGEYSTLDGYTMYAQWHLDYVNPSMTNFVAYRVETSSSSTQVDTGKYIYISFGYVGGVFNNVQIPPEIEIQIDGSPVYDQVQQAASGTFTQRFGEYTENTSFTVSVRVFDSHGEVTASAEIPSAIFPIDILADGSGMGLMTPAVQGTTLLLHDGTVVDGSLSTDSLTINSNLVVDYVIEENVLANGGQYRKWASGKAEFWYHVSESSGITTTTWSAPICYFDDTTTFTNLWSGVFNVLPYSVNISGSFSQFISYIPYSYDKDGIKTLRFVSVTARTNSGYAFSVYAEGTWR